MINAYEACANESRSSDGVGVPSARHSSTKLRGHQQEALKKESKKYQSQ